MPPTRSTDIAIIGGGVIGLAIAERLAAEGHEVTLIDPNPPSATISPNAASYGNAGTIADYAILPVGTPDVLRNLPSLLFDKNSPLAIRRAALPAFLPWLARFALQSLPKAAEKNARTIAALMATATADWLDLGTRLGGGEILKKHGCLYVYETAPAFRAAEKDMAFRRALGVTVDLIDAATLRQMEPALPEVEGGAAFFPKAVFLNDPGRMVGLLAAEVALQAETLTARVERLERQADGILLTGHGLHLKARRVVLAAGAHSRKLAAMVGDRVPLDTERGYHVEWDMPTPPVTRPTCPTTRGFYLCPMQGRLRVAGTVELGGLTAPPSPHRVAKLVEGARQIFPDLPTSPSRNWMGFRPSMPDSVPVIGPSRAGADVIHAFGHGHLGVSLAPVTARIVADLIAGRPPHMPLAPLSPARF
jgi:glycine/D-amino acid oxidase-like deaminating enzyme